MERSDINHRNRGYDLTPIIYFGAIFLAFGQKKSPQNKNKYNRKYPGFRKTNSLRSFVLLHPGLKSYAAPRLAIRRIRSARILRRSAAHRVCKQTRLQFIQTAIRLNILSLSRRSCPLSLCICLPGGSRNCRLWLSRLSAVGRRRNIPISGSFPREPPPPGSPYDPGHDLA